VRRVFQRRSVRRYPIGYKRLARLADLLTPLISFTNICQEKDGRVLNRRTAYSSFPSCYHLVDSNLSIPGIVL
jgi:hypothetical protein